MFRTLLIGAVSVAALALSVAAFAQKPEFGTAAEAKTMLERAIPVVKADKAAAFAKFLKGEDGFKDRDLYVFCFNADDGKINAAPPAVLGKDARTLVDKVGDNYGKRIYEQANAKGEGVISEITYMFPRPNSDVPVQKTSFITKVAGQVCGVGYYQ